MPRFRCAAVVCLLLVHAAPASAQRWPMITSDNLTVIGDAPPRALRDLTVDIEQFREVVGSVFRDAGRGPNIPTVVYIFSTRTRMRDFLPVVDGKKIEVVGLMTRDGEINRILMTLEDQEESSKLAFHEYTHLLTGNTGRRLPLWLTEGLAEFYSTYHVMDGGRTADIGRALPSSLAYLRERWLPLADMVAAEGGLMHDSARRDVFYPQAWALVHYVMTQMPTGVAAINAYINAVNAGASNTAAFEPAFGESIDSVERKLRLYVQRQIFTHARFTFTDRIAARAPSPPRTLSQAEADAWLGDLQLAERLLPEATARIESAVSREPGLAMAHIAAGRLRASQDRHDDARQALSHAASLAPDDYIVQWSWAISGLRLGAVRGDASALAVLRRVTALRPESAEGLALFGYVAMQSAATREEARAAIEKAMSLAPERLDYRLRFAELLMLANQTLAARTVLRPLASQRLDAVTAERAGAHLRDVEAFEAQRAAAAKAVEAVRPPAAASTPTPGVPATATAPPPNSASSSTSATPPLRLGSNGAFVANGVDALQQRNRRLSFLLRAVGSGEERAFGRLVQLECLPGGEVRFHLATEGRTVVVAASSMSNVELTQYRDNSESTLRCATRSPADVVFITWRKGTAGQGLIGTAVAVEFLPDDFVP